jgi:hypothetical protein
MTYKLGETTGVIFHFPKKNLNSAPTEWFGRLLTSQSHVSIFLAFSPTDFTDLM